MSYDNYLIENKLKLLDNNQEEKKKLKQRTASVEKHLTTSQIFTDTKVNRNSLVEEYIKNIQLTKAMADNNELLKSDSRPTVEIEVNVDRNRVLAEDNRNTDIFTVS